MLHAVIMAGGAGTRFWPASRSLRPKQLLNLTGERTMIQETVARLEGLVAPEQLLVVTNERLVEPIRDQLPDVPAEAILGEPCKRDTAPCIGVAAAWVLKHDPDAIMAVMPADHVIPSVDVFQHALRHAVELIEEEPSRIVTFGIKPTYPAEIFGYVERTGASLRETSFPTYQVERFREKPNAELAAEFRAQGTFYWNSGIFLWRAETILSAIRQYEPQMATHLERIADAIGTPQFETVFRDEFTAIEGKSIDFAVMEHYQPVVVVEAPFAWDDVGNWPALERLLGADEQGNTIQGKHLGVATEGSIVRSEGDHLVVTVGMHNCIVVHTPDATLVADRAQEEQIRQVVKELQARGWSEYL